MFRKRTCGLTRDGPKLLSRVNGRKHATDDDHEEPRAKRKRSPIKQKISKDEDINAEPASTDDEPATTDNELRAPTPRSARPAKVVAPQEADELKSPPKKVVKAGSKNDLNSPAKRDTRDGTKEVADYNKENSSSAVPRSSSSSTQQGIFDEMAYGSQNSGRTSKGIKFGSRGKVTNNIHAPATTKVVKRKEIRAPKSDKRKTKKTIKKGKAPVDGDDDLSDLSMLSIDELEKVLGSAKESDPELRTVDTKKASKRMTGSRSIVLYGQLGDWIKDRGLGSSQPDSSAPSEDMNVLKEYIEQLPEEEVEGSRCPLCSEPVNDDDYWDYWKGKEKTVKNQNKFCHEHRTKSAWDEYRSEGYPDITWTDLPHRIRKHRMTLYKILNNERSSDYRTRYEPIALTGNAAAVPTKRKDLPEHVQQELESYALDHQSVYPGYYGPHGRRVITENVMKLLKNEIKNCTDAVVQGSGPATFVQAVLVPEMAVLLIMEDCRVDRVEAEDIREKTYELGMLLNEEIEDRIELHDHSEDENEYGVR